MKKNRLKSRHGVTFFALLLALLLALTSCAGGGSLLYPAGSGGSATTAATTAPPPGNNSTVTMTFGSSGNAAVHGNGSDALGSWSYDKAKGALALTYAATPDAYLFGNYTATVSFKGDSPLTSAHRFAVVCYSATFPSGVTSSRLLCYTPAYPSARAADDGIVAASDLRASTPLELSEETVAALLQGEPLTLVFGTIKKKATFYVQSVHFFTSKRAATNFASSYDP